MNELTAETLELLKGSLAQANPDILSKAITLGTNLVAYDLQAPAKNLYPFVTPIRNVMPRVSGGTGRETNWREVSAIIGSGFDSMGWVPEGQRSGSMSYTTASRSATYVTIGEEDYATFEAINAGRTFEDIQAKMTFRLLQKMMLKEEMAILAGNATMALGTPGTPTVATSANTASTLPTATYYVRVVALTTEGYYNSSTTAGVATTANVTGADADSYAVNGGSSAISAESAGQATTVSVTGLAMSVAAVQGAAAYAWFIGSATNTETLEAITTTNTYVRLTPLTGTGQPYAAITSDHSLNANTAFDGLLTTALKSGSNAYVKIMATGTLGTGTALTSSGTGGVDEIDTMFTSMWDTYQVSPTVIYVNSQELKNITKKVLSNTSAPLLSYRSDANPASAAGYQITASGVVENYFNPYHLQGGQRIPIRIHPKVPPGMIIGWAEDLPIQYQSNEVPNVAEIKTRQDYYQIDWPVITRKRSVGVYSEEVLAVYAPFAMGVICNISNG